MANDSGKYTKTLGFAGILAGSLIVALDAVALSPSLPIIEDDLTATTIETYWASVAYTLGSATFLPLFPAASNIAGRRPISILTLVLFFVGTIVCGTAHNVGALLAGRVIQGVGGGGIIGMMYVVMTDLYDLRTRPKALAVNGLVWLVGTSLGPIMGGGFSGNVSWRWIFWIALPINVVALILVAFFLVIPRDVVREGVPRTTSESEKEQQGRPGRAYSWRNLDYFGAALLVASLSSFLIAITWGGVQHPWSSASTLVPLILGIAGIAAYVAYELLVPAIPLVPLRILCNRTVGISLMQTFAVGVIQFGVVFYLPVYYQFVKGYSPLISGVALLPVTLLSGPVTMVTGNLIAKTGKYKTCILVGWAFMALGCGLLDLLKVNTSIAAWIFINVPIGIAAGILFAATSVSVQAPVKQEDAAVVSGLIGFFRSIGQAVEITCGNTIILNVFKGRLHRSSVLALQQNAALIASNIASPKVISAFGNDMVAKKELLDAYVGGLEGVWWLLLAVACICGLSTFLIQDVGLEGDKQNNISSTGGTSAMKDAVGTKSSSVTASVAEGSIV